MSRVLRTTVLLLLAIGGTAVAAFAQGLPTSQPGLLYLVREEVKVGHVADHPKVEAGWPAAFEKAKSPYYYVALASLSGTPEVWFVAPFENHAAFGDSLKRESEDAALSAELDRLSRADAEHVTSVRQIQAVARKELSHGEFPDVAKQRFYEISIFRVKPGHESGFVDAAKAYGAAAGRGAPDVNYRVYQVIAGMPEPTYLIFSSVVSFGDFDKMMTSSEATMKAATDDERKTLQTFLADGVYSTETFRFRLDPAMSYVPKEVRDSDPAFWAPKKPMAKPAPKPTTN
jgi:hypothetical protein